GLEAATKGLEVCERRGIGRRESMLLRVNGELLLMKEPRDNPAAEGCFRSAIGVAQAQGARFVELTATTSLARILRDTGRTDAARAMLAEIYNWFTEGFDTADLKDAKALLDELGIQTVWQDHGS